MTEFLKEQFNKYPDTKLWFNNKKTREHWTSWKKFNECTSDELKQANLREIFPNEIILDIDKKEQLEEIQNDLISNNYNFSVWETGSRGYHIQLIFDNLELLDEPHRKIIRSIFSSKYKTDKAKDNESTLVSKENRFHFKTGNTIKKALQENYSTNTLTPEIIEQAKEIKCDECERDTFIIDEAYKDYHTIDSFFQFIKANIFPESQERNNILFKNLAIGLCKEGLSKHQIKELIEPLIKTNFPGKNINEFMGWVNKTLKGELIDYNIYELNMWAKKYNYTPFYKEAEEIQNIAKLLDIKNLWKNYWNENIIEQDVWGELLFYHLIDCVIDEREFDLRIHITMISTTSSAKDRGIDLCYEILKTMEIECTKLTQATDRALVGSVNADQLRRNINTDRIETSEKYIDPREPGLLYTNKSLAYPEAEWVFKAGLHSREVQSIFRITCDELREICKAVGGMKLKYLTNTSLILASYPEEYVLKDILKNGLFQRMFNFYNNVSEETQMKILKFTVDKEHTLNKKFKTSIYREELLEKLKNIKEYWNINKYEIIKQISENINKELLYEKIKKLKHKYGFLEEEEKRLLNAMLIRGCKNIYKLIILNSLVNETQNYTKNSEEAINLYEKCIDSMVNIIWETKRSRKISMPTREDNAVINLIRTYGNEGKIDLGILNTKIEETIEKTKSSRSKDKLLDTIEKAGFIKRIREGDKKIVILCDI